MANIRVYIQAQQAIKSARRRKGPSFLLVTLRRASALKSERNYTKFVSMLETGWVYPVKHDGSAFDRKKPLDGFTHGDDRFFIVDKHAEQVGPLLVLFPNRVTAQPLSQPANDFSSAAKAAWQELNTRLKPDSDQKKPPVEKVDSRARFVLLSFPIGDIGSEVIHKQIDAGNALIVPFRISVSHKGYTSERIYSVVATEAVGIIHRDLMPYAFAAEREKRIPSVPLNEGGVRVQSLNEAYGRAWVQVKDMPGAVKDQKYAQSLDRPLSSRAWVTLPASYEM